MHVHCDLFDVLDFAERNEDLSKVEGPTSPCCQRQVAYMKSPTYFCLCMFSLLYLSMHAKLMNHLGGFGN